MVVCLRVGSHAHLHTCFSEEGGILGKGSGSIFAHACHATRTLEVNQALHPHTHTPPPHHILPPRLPLRLLDVIGEKLTACQLEPHLTLPRPPSQTVGRGASHPEEEEEEEGDHASSRGLQKCLPQAH